MMQKAINERWLSGMNCLCTRIETERYIFDDAVHLSTMNAKPLLFVRVLVSVFILLVQWSKDLT